MAATRVRPAVPHWAALYLAVIQFFFVTTWIIYVIFLPTLAESVGIPREMSVWILVLDQLTFTFTDFLLGFMADRVGRFMGRVGPFIVGLTAVSCLAFFAMPHIAAVGSGPVASGLFLFVIVIWVVSSSALRAPPWVFLCRYSADTTLPWLSALYFTGLSVGNAASAYLGVALRNQDPRLPFAVSSVTLFAVTIGLIWVERTLQARREIGGAGVADRESLAADHALPPLATPASTAFLAAAALLSLGFQANIAFNAIPQYLRYAQPSDLDYLLPLFWVGFNITTFPAAALAPRWGGARVLVLASALGGLGTLLAALSPNLVGTMLGQIMVGGGWGAVLMAGLATALHLGRTGREGAISGLWFSTQSIAAFLRIGVVALQLDRAPNFPDLTRWAAPILWLGAGVVLAGLAWQARDARPRLAGSL